MTHGSATTSGDGCDTVLHAVHDMAGGKTGTAVRVSDVAARLGVEPGEVRPRPTCWKRTGG